MLLGKNLQAFYFTIINLSPVVTGRIFPDREIFPEGNQYVSEQCLSINPADYHRGGKSTVIKIQTLQSSFKIYGKLGKK